MAVCTVLPPPHIATGSRWREGYHFRGIRRRAARPITADQAPCVSRSRRRPRIRT